MLGTIYITALSPLVLCKRYLLWLPRMVQKTRWDDLQNVFPAINQTGLLVVQLYLGSSIEKCITCIGYLILFIFVCIEIDSVYMKDGLFFAKFICKWLFISRILVLGNIINKIQGGGGSYSWLKTLFVLFKRQLRFS